MKKIFLFCVILGMASGVFAFPYETCTDTDGYNERSYVWITYQKIRLYRRGKFKFVGNDPNLYERVHTY